MTSRERVLSAIAQRGYDRLPVRFDAVGAVVDRTMAHFGVSDMEALVKRIGDDFRLIGPEYAGPEMRTFPNGTREGWWGQITETCEPGYEPATVFLPCAEVTEVSALDGIRMPTVDWFDFSTIKEQCLRYPEHARILGNPGYMDLINGVARCCRGREQVFVDIALQDPVYLALVERRYNLYYQMTERGLMAADGMVDIVWAGEDLGTQTSLIISPKSFDEIYAPRYEAFFKMVHQYGAKTMLHVCGAIFEIIPRLIELGLDILDVVQVGATGMDLRRLRDAYGDRLCFSGTMDVQTILVNGKPADIRREVELRRQLFPSGGLILAPTNSMVKETPLENILAMYEAAGSMAEKERSAIGARK